MICSSIRTRSARVRARPSSSAILPNSSSIWRRTSTWFVRSSFGSSSLMSRFWTRNFASRKDSRAGMAPVKREGICAGGRRRRLPAGGGLGGEALPHEPAGPAAGTAGVAVPSAAGRARSMRFNSDMCRVLPISGVRRVRAWRPYRLGWRRALASEGAGERDDVARQRRLRMRDTTKGTPRFTARTASRPSETIEPSMGRRMEASTSPMRMPWAGIGTVDDEADLRALVVELVGHLQEEADVLDRRDLEGRDDHDLVRRVEHAERVVVEARRQVDDDPSRGSRAARSIILRR